MGPGKQKAGGTASRPAGALSVMYPPITQKILIDWGGTQVLRDAQAMIDDGLVLEASYDPPHIRGAVRWNNRELRTSLKILPDGSAESQCPCYANRERGIICPHVIAVGLTLVRRATDPEREAKYREELRRASHVAALNEQKYHRRVGPDTPGAIPARIRAKLSPQWAEAFSSTGRLAMSAEVEYRGRVMPVDEVPTHVPLSLSKRGESLLYVLEDISQGPAGGKLELAPADFVSILRLHAGRTLPRADDSPATVNRARLSTLLRMDVDRENGELILIAHTELPFMKAGQFPLYIVSGREAWVYGADNFWPLEAVFPSPYHDIYKHPIAVPRPNVLRFLENELPVLRKSVPVESDITLDLFTTEPATPASRLLVRGSPASLSAILYAEYDGIVLTAGKPDAKGQFAAPDPDDIMRYTVRNPEAEALALQIAADAGLPGPRGDQLVSIVGKRNVLNFLGTHLPALRRRGWRVDLRGRVSGFLDSLDFATPIVRISDIDKGDWFDVGFDFEDGQGRSLSHADVQRALRKGDAHLAKDGRILLIDADAVRAMHDVFSDCATGESDEAGHFRMADVYAGFVKSSLDALDGIDVEDVPSWRKRAAEANRTAELKPIAVGEPLEGQLRPYQKEGVYWLHFLDTNGFGGLLADEMGLGKTIQALAWIQVSRRERAPSEPVLVVCPTSIVENWAEEAARFTPDLKVLILAGSDRHSKWPDLPASDLAITSYALLRRDLDRLLETDFDAVILDEAQHIKNRSTQNAVAAKKLKTRHHLVLTGTPLENSVADLWSIMDFLMPGYLGSHQAFKGSYENPIAQGGPEAQLCQAKLRRKLQPFLVRRRKREVATELPPKIEKVSFCTLTADQALVYRELMESSRSRVQAMVKKQGFVKSRMQILALLMRLRQVCCHLDLLKLPDLKPKYPSAKMESFWELVDEALDSGHRILVFSQFVSMLRILTAELNRRQIEYCYLDGSTKNRMSVVRQFNTERRIPLFLISLKAGGTGLNLTGADMVIHFDPWWNPAVENQATDRAYRIGQKRTVYSIKLITKETVEERVLELQRRKSSVIDATIESDEGIVQSITWNDIRELLSL